MARKKVKEPGQRFAEELGRFLATAGWQVIVAGASRIEQISLETRKLNYRFVIDFMGRPPKESETER